MQYLSGYNNQVQDIGLFTLYRQQAQFQHSKSIKQLARIAESKRQHKYHTPKKITKSRRALTVQNQQKTQLLSNFNNKYTSQNCQQQYDIHQQQITKINVKKYKNQQIFANRKYNPQRKSKQGYKHSFKKQQTRVCVTPKSNPIQFSHKNTYKFQRKNNLNTHRISKQQLLQNEIDVKLPKIKYKKSNKMKQYQQQRQKQIQRQKSIEQENKKYRYVDSQKHCSITNKKKNRQVLNIKINKNKSLDESFGSYIMISSRQYQMLELKKQVPIITMLQKYSRKG